MIDYAAMTSLEIIDYVFGNGEPKYKRITPDMITLIVDEVTVDTDGEDFESNGVKFRFYRDILWSNGGEHDDLVIRRIETGDAKEITIEITFDDLTTARDHQEYIAEPVEDDFNQSDYDDYLDSRGEW